MEETIKYLQEKFSNRPIKENGQPASLPRFECESGFSFYLEASLFHGCLPRENKGPYTHVELLYPSKEVKGIPTGRHSGVYPRVPIQEIARVIIENGGIKK